MTCSDRPGGTSAHSADEQPAAQLHDRPHGGRVGRDGRRADEDPAIGAVVLTGAAEGVFHHPLRRLGDPRRVGGVRHPVSKAVAGGALRTAGRSRGYRAGRTPCGARPRWACRAAPHHDLFVRMNRSGTVFVRRSTAWRWRRLRAGAGLRRAHHGRTRRCPDRPARDHARDHPGRAGRNASRACSASRALEMMLEGRVLAPHEAASWVGATASSPRRAGREAAATAERPRPPLARNRRRAQARGVRRRVAIPGRRAAHGARGVPVGHGAPPALRAMRAYVDELERLGDARRGRTTRSWPAGSRASPLTSSAE